VRDALTGQRLLYMVTTGAAMAIGLDRYLGTLAPGFRADILGVRRASGVTDPYENLAKSDPRAVELVVVDGKALVVSAANQALGGVPLAGPCEPVDACGVQRHVCLTTSVGALVSRVKAAYPQVAPLADCSERPLQ
jgi:hypothetical protein